LGGHELDKLRTDLDLKFKIQIESQTG
jgi:hypothetical protein